jgi:Raf kinase inhibitor-like YbhB/YbcL family protein
MNSLKLAAATFLFTALTFVSAQSSSFSLRSSDIKPGSIIASEFVFNSFGCTGKNVSPALGWSNAPTNTKSFALIVHDPDARTGVGGFTHWIVYNIPASSSSLSQGAGTTDGKTLPAGATQAATSFGTPGWGGPCPPAGEKPHRYVFTLYALGTEKLELPMNAGQAFIGFNIVGNAITKTSFTALYGR